MSKLEFHLYHREKKRIFGLLTYSLSLEVFHNKEKAIETIITSL